MEKLLHSCCATDCVPPPGRKPWIRSRSLLAGSIIFLAALLTLACPPLLPVNRLADSMAEQFGWLLCAAGITIRLWATLYIGGRKNQVLATTGPYSVTRNPLYFGTLITALGFAVALQSIYMLAAVLLATPLYTQLAIPHEERNLERRWGFTYRQYVARVPQFWPNPLLWQSPRSVQVNVANLAREFGRGFAWVFLVMAARLWIELH